MPPVAASLSSIALSEREKGAHLLRRFGLGASEAELDYYLQGGYRAAVERLLDPMVTEEPYSIDIESVARDKNGKVVLQPRFVSVWWGMKLLTTRRPLLEKMTVFWHDHFATGADKVKGGALMYEQNETLRAHALGKFGDLLGAVAKDPAMLLYLDNQENVKGHANENFAREVMELFTLGIGHYTEKDVQEAARAFTGWAFRKKGADGSPEFYLRQRLHDSGEKTVLGTTGTLEGEDVLGLLTAHPATAERLVHKIWSWFVYPDPTSQTLAPFVRAYSDSGLDTTALLRAIMTSDEFVSPRAVRHSFKNPVDFCVVTLRQLGIGEAIGASGAVGKPNPAARRAGVAAAATNAMRSQGMWLLYPPDVSGWKPGEAWVTSATMVERIGWAARIFGQAEKNNLPGGYRAYDLLSPDPTPKGIVDRFVSVFDVPITAPQHDLLVSVATKALGAEGLTPKNANVVAAQVCRPLFGLPGFQMA